MIEIFIGAKPQYFYRKPFSSIIHSFYDVTQTITHTVSFGEVENYFTVTRKQ